jgi:hypothetical protein
MLYNSEEQKYCKYVNGGCGGNVSSIKEITISSFFSSWTVCSHSPYVMLSTDRLKNMQRKSLTKRLMSLPSETIYMDW